MLLLLLLLSQRRTCLLHVLKIRRTCLLERVCSIQVDRRTCLLKSGRTCPLGRACPIQNIRRTCLFKTRRTCLLGRTCPIQRYHVRSYLLYWYTVYCYTTTPILRCTTIIPLHTYILLLLLTGYLLFTHVVNWFTHAQLSVVEHLHLCCNRWLLLLLVLLLLLYYPKCWLNATVYL